ncbi:hypothetical protein GN956_G5929 [Arapaima gigas]
MVGADGIRQRETFGEARNLLLSLKTGMKRAGSLAAKLQCDTTEHPCERVQMETKQDEVCFSRGIRAEASGLEDGIQTSQAGVRSSSMVTQRGPASMRAAGRERGFDTVSVRPTLPSTATRNGTHIPTAEFWLIIPAPHSLHSRPADILNRKLPTFSSDPQEVGTLLYG